MSIYFSINFGNPYAFKIVYAKRREPFLLWSGYNIIKWKISKIAHLKGVPVQRNEITGLHKN